MFTALENELIRILRANLSAPAVTPPFVPSNRIVNGPIAPPPPGQLPTIAISADAFQLVPLDEPAPPRGVKVLVEENFSPNGTGPFALDRSPLEPLRAVEVEETPSQRVLLRERDDYTVDYVNRQVRFRRPPEGDIFIQYFTLQPLRILSATRFRVDCRLDIWASPNPDNADNLETIGTIAVGAVGANAAAIDGLLAPAREIVDSGLPSLGTRQAFFAFGELRPVEGRQTASNQWTLNYIANATLLLVPADEEVGVMRYMVTGIAWDENLAERVLSTLPPILSRPVTIIQGVGAATADALAVLGVTTVSQLAQLAPTGQTAIDTAIPRARIVRDRARTVVRQVVQSAPNIPDVTAFLAQPLDEVDAGDLTVVDIPAGTATEIVAALADLLAQTTAPDLALSDIFFQG